MSDLDRLSDINSSSENSKTANNAPRSNIGIIFTTDIIFRIIDIIPMIAIIAPTGGMKKSHDSTDYC